MKKNDENSSSLNVQMDELAEMQKKLVLMEQDLKVRCDDYDKRVAALSERESAVKKREDLINKTEVALASSESFAEMVKLTDQIYTMYVSAHSSDKGLYDALKLILDARQRYQPDKDA